MSKVYCLINGEGEIVKKTKNSIVVKFKNGLDSESIYSLDGHLIMPNGKKSPTKVLFDTKPKIVTDKALIDDLGNVIEDKDFIVYGKKDSKHWEAGFFDAENLSLFTSEGYRNPQSLFKQIDADMVLFKINNEGIESYKDNLKDESLKTIQKEVSINNQEPQIEKTAVKKENEQNELLVVSITGGTVNCNYPGSISTGDTVSIPVVDKKVKVDMIKNIGAEANATITFNASKLFNVISNNDERALRDYIDLFDACVITNKGQKNLNSSDVLYYIQDGKLMVDFKLN